MTRTVSSQTSRCSQLRLTASHGRRDRARLALEGLSIGDAFGDRFFINSATIESLIESRAIPKHPWRWSDDTAMGLAIFEVLKIHSGINQDALARAFADGYSRDMARKYGGTAHEILQGIASGVPWHQAAQDAFGGHGSMGNGAAMRVAPVGAYFADDYPLVVEQAIRSAQPTHAHPDGQAGAVAVAVAAAFACRVGSGQEEPRGDQLLRLAIEMTPEGPTRDGLVKASTLPLSYDVRTAVSALGNGSKVISSDTVPFSLWCAARHLTDFEEAMWTTVSGLGDRDTTCAIVGGIVALSVGASRIPQLFLEAREPLSWPLPLGEKQAPNARMGIDG